MRVPPVVMERFDAARANGPVSLRVTRTRGRSGPSWRLTARVEDPVEGSRDFVLMSHADQEAVEAVRDALREMEPGAVTLICPLGHRFTIPPVVYGYPTPETVDAAERGEITIGGCLPDVPVERTCPVCGLAATSDPEWASGRASGEPATSSDDSPDRPI